MPAGTGPPVCLGVGVSDLVVSFGVARDVAVGGAVGITVQPVGQTVGLVEGMPDRFVVEIGEGPVVLAVFRVGVLVHEADGTPTMPTRSQRT